MTFSQKLQAVETLTRGIERVGGPNTSQAQLMQSTLEAIVGGLLNEEQQFVDVKTEEGWKRVAYTPEALTK